MFNSEEGSIVVESSFVLPVVLIVLLVMMTFVMFYHDQIVIQLAIENSTPNSMEEIQLMIGNNTILKGGDSVVSSEGGRIRIQQRNPLRLFESESDMVTYKLPGKRRARLYKILFVEKIENYIEMITMDLLAKLNVDELLKQILTRLKTN